jgi:hypothetical protein
MGGGRDDSGAPMTLIRMTALAAIFIQTATTAALATQVLFFVPPS